MIGAARAAGADAIHPGYGFLAESPRLARACAAAGLVFIGPTAGQLEAAGDKLAARDRAAAAGLPVLPGGAVERDRRGGRRWRSGSAGRSWSRPPAAAAAGACGRSGRPADLGAAVERAIAEAGAAFGDPRVYLERYVQPGRHVEVQLLGDGERVIHLGDRDCSVQRRYQKLLEEAPAPRLDDGLRAEIRRAAVAFGELLGYRGLGTVEFLVDAERGGFWFLEMNARIQVEHPVTEAVCGLDLVAEQIAVAEGRPLRLAQDDVRLAGHAIECRINAEDPADGFRPSPGTVTRAVFPAGPGIRVDTHLQAGSAVPAGYDSLLAKVIASGRDRAEALHRLRRALARCRDRRGSHDHPAARRADRTARVRARRRGHRLPGPVPRGEPWLTSSWSIRRSATATRACGARRASRPRTSCRSPRSWTGSASGRSTSARAPTWACRSAPTRRTPGS